MLVEKNKSKRLTYETTIPVFSSSHLCYKMTSYTGNPLTLSINTSFLSFSESLNRVKWLNNIKLEVIDITSTVFSSI